MRFVTQTTTASLLLAGLAVFSIAPAIAGPDEAHQDSFWTSQTTYGTQSSGAPHYIQVEPRDAKPADGGKSVDANNVYFNHSMGTMTSSPDANYAEQSTPAGNDRYTASYQQYMQVDPRDAKVDPNASSNVDGSNIYFNHAMGTMSGSN